MSHSPSSNSNLHDIITEESPPAYTPYPNSGEQSMAFGPRRPLADNNATQDIPQQQQNNYEVLLNQDRNHIQYTNNNNNNNNPSYEGNVTYGYARPTYA